MRGEGLLAPYHTNLSMLTVMFYNLNLSTVFINLIEIEVLQTLCSSPSSKPYIYIPIILFRNLVQPDVVWAKHTGLRSLIVRESQWRIATVQSASTRHTQEVRLKSHFPLGRGPVRTRHAVAEAFVSNPFQGSLESDLVSCGATPQLLWSSYTGLYCR